MPIYWQVNTSNGKDETMRDEQQQRIALECLKLAVTNADVMHLDPLENAARFYAFVTGEDADDAKAKLAAVREAIT